MQKVGFKFVSLRSARPWPVIASGDGNQLLRERCDAARADAGRAVEASIFRLQTGTSIASVLSF
jgi:hypothetical protein